MLLNPGEVGYLDLLRRALEHGEPVQGRNGGVRQLFGQQLRFDLTQGFPLLTTKRVHFKSVWLELLWFLRGETNVAWLQERGVTIWDKWADTDGELGPVYGSQWRDFGGVDQISTLIEGLKTAPHGRRHIVSAWNVADLEQMALPPCHAFFQVVVHRNRLNLMLHQRSADLFLGVPFNIASYAALLPSPWLGDGLSAR